MNDDNEQVIVEETSTTDENDVDEEQQEQQQQQQQQQEQQQQQRYMDDPSYTIRKQMELRANHLIQQVELIESTTSNTTRNRNNHQNKYNSSTASSALDTTLMMNNLTPNNFIIDDGGSVPPRMVSLSSTLTESSTNTTPTNSLHNISICSNSSTSLSLHLPVDDGTDGWLNNDSTIKNDETDDVHRQPFHHLQSTAALADDLSSNDEDTTSRMIATHVDGEDSNNKYFQARMYELEVENAKLRQTVSTVQQSVTNVQTNADLKLLQAQMELTHTKQRLSDEVAMNSKMMVLNQSLRKQLNVAASDIIQNKHTHRDLFCEFITVHQRELIVEKHLNSLILSRNAAMKDYTDLKLLLLSTCCYSCRQHVAPHVRHRRSSSSSRRRTSNTISGNEGNQQQLSDDGTSLDGSYAQQSSVSSSQNSSPISVSSPPRRGRPVPTYQSSARQLVLDQQPLFHASSSSTTGGSSSNSVGGSARSLKSCLKKSTPIAQSGDSIHNIHPVITTTTGPITDAAAVQPEYSPTSTTTLILDTLPRSLSIVDEKHVRKRTMNESFSSSSSGSMANTTRSSSVADHRGGGDVINHSTQARRNQVTNQQAPQINNTNYENDTWSNTSDMSATVSTVPQNHGAAVTMMPIDTVVQNERRRASTNNHSIPDAATQRKLDIRRQDDLLGVTSQRSNSFSSISPVVVATPIRTVAASPVGRKNQSQPPQQRSGFFGLRKKKENFI